MKHTLNKLNACLAVILFTVFCVFSLGQNAFSAPKWIKITYSKPTLQVVGKDKNNSGYLALKVSVIHKNNSKNGEVITAIFDKELGISYTIRNYIGLGSKGNRFTTSVKSNKVNKVDIYPGQKFTLYYLVPIQSKGNYQGSFREFNDQILRDYKSGGVDSIFKDRKYSYNFQIKKEK